ncbi:flavin reductase family protein [Herbiconiux ginsengi]|uniref:NADH-FMN oxidoreductase RutF, flavin reductase (DIM6/NTAB) family n=1 Tax=Herbiconiux ginsengi TaxID=381665 RepID=A0A1H3T761_9MICO|nr:flavin reductase family protein [Herbiconiux ginsengi]SDZ45555.1 NADH-FMN oxidoreductase RutF, flavin reductase (DIM6/NTAB) family [Herbiconiux ginsengi]
MSVTDRNAFQHIAESVSDLSPEEFKGAFRSHPAGVAVVTAQGENGPAAMTVSSLFSVSAVPPLLVFSASALSSSTASIRSAETLVVHMLTSDDLELARLCATSGADRFDGSIPWSRLDTGEPYFEGVKTTLRGQIVNQLDAGASTLIIVKALDVRNQGVSVARPLVYHNRTWHALDGASTIAG